VTPRVPNGVVDVMVTVPAAPAPTDRQEVRPTAEMD
jgi:hypothetical protein